MIRFQLSASKFLSLSRVGAHLKLRWVCAAFTFWYSCPQANNRPIKLQPKLLPRCSEISFRYFRYIWPRSSNQSLIASLLRYFLDQSRSLFWGQHQIILKKVISLIYIDIVSNLDSMEELSQKHFLCVTVFYSLIHCLPLPSILGRVTARVWIYQITILLLAKTFETCISFAALQYFSFCIYPFSQFVLLLLRPRRLRHERVRLLFLIQICVLDPLNALVPPSDYIKVR